MDEDGLLDLVRTLPGKKGAVTPKSEKKKKSTGTPSSASKDSPKNVNNNNSMDLEEEFEMDFDDSILLESDMSMEVVPEKQEVKKDKVEPVVISSQDSDIKDSVKKTVISSEV